jgi:hypothetical protein
MERLYSVPSEQLRVWTVWLTNVSDIADDWQKWLRMYIDTVTQIAECVQMAMNDVVEDEIPEDEVLEDEEEEREIELVSSNVIPLYRTPERKLSESNRKSRMLCCCVASAVSSR